MKEIIDLFDKKLDSIIVDLKSLNDELKELNTLTKQMHHDLYGNGKKGVMKTVEENSTLSRQMYNDLYGNGNKSLIKRVEEMEEEIVKHSKYFWLMGLICGGLYFIIDKVWK